MGRADTHLAACAVAVGLFLAAAHGAVAVADTPASSGSQSNNSASSDNDSSPSSTHSPEGTSEAGTKTADTQPSTTLQTNPVAATESAQDERTDDVTKKKPVDKESKESCAGNHHDKTLTPSPAPEAPPVQRVPMPNTVAPALEAPPPLDLPPAVPNAPVEPDPVDTTTGDAGARHSHGHELPILNVPLLALPSMPPHVLGASAAVRATSSGEVAQTAPAGEPRPWLLRASTSEPIAETPVTSGLSAGGQAPKDYTYGYASRSLTGMTAGAMPGIAGMLLMTASGIGLGYRQAKAQLALMDSADRFLN
jgi:hypothetical protein